MYRCGMTRTIEEAVGQRIRERREGLTDEDGKPLTQERLGAKLGDYLGVTWTRQAVYTAERGGRDFRAVELAALAAVLDVSVSWLMSSTDPVEFPTGRRLQPGIPVVSPDVVDDISFLVKGRLAAFEDFLTTLDVTTRVTAERLALALESMREVGGEIQRLTETTLYDPPVKEEEEEE